MKYYTQSVLNELIIKINILNCSLKNCDSTKISKIVKDILNTPPITLFQNSEFAKYDELNNPDVFFGRVRRVNNEKIDIIKNVDQFWMLPPDKVKEYGRLNKKNESVLYTSHNSSLVPIAEVGAKVGDTILIIMYERIKNNTIILEKLAVNNNQLIKLDNFVSKINNIKFNFMKEWLTKKGDHFDSNILYEITNVIKEHFIHNKGKIDGLIYPTVTGDNTTYNIAFFNSVRNKKIRISYAYYGKLVKSEKNRIVIESFKYFSKIEGSKVIWNTNDNPKLHCFYL